MLIGKEIKIQEDQYQAITYSLLAILYLGAIRNNELLQDQVQKQSIITWQ